MFQVKNVLWVAGDTGEWVADLDEVVRAAMAVQEFTGDGLAAWDNVWVELDEEDDGLFVLHARKNDVEHYLCNPGEMSRALCLKMQSVLYDALTVIGKDLLARNAARDLTGVPYLKAVEQHGYLLKRVQGAQIR
jgi:hypothetical protein